MTPRVPLPTPDQIAAAIAVETEQSRRPPAALAVARRLGMSNATFWRHFPRVAQELADARRSANRSVQRRVATDSGPNAAVTIARLRAENVGLQDDIKVAAAEVQRLTLENHVLRAQLETAAGITPIQRRD